MKPKHRLLTTVFFRFLLPTVLAAAAMQLVFVIGGMIVGHTLGSDYLAAMNLTMPLVQVLVACGVFFGIGGSVLVASYKGEHRPRRCSEVFTLSLAGMLFSGVAISVSGLLLRNHIVALLAGNATSLAPHVSEFLFPLLLAAPLVVLTVGMAYPIRTDGNPNLSSGLLLCANLLNIALIPVLIPLLGNLSAYGWGMLVGYACSTAGLYRYFVWPDRTLRIVRPRMLFSDSARLVLNGLPVASTGLMIPVMIYCINRTAMHYAGTPGLAVFSIVMSCILVISLIIAGTVQTMMPMTGILYGEKDWDGLRYVFRLSFATVAFFASALILFLESSPGFVLALFGINDGELFELGTQSLRIFAPAVGGIALVGLLRSHAQAIKRPVLAFSLVFVENLGAMLPSVWGLSHLLGYRGIWYGYVLAEFSALAFYLICAAVIVRFNRSLHGFLLLPIPEDWQERHVAATFSRNERTGREGALAEIALFLQRWRMPDDDKERLLDFVQNSIRILLDSDGDGKTRLVDLRLECHEGKTHLFLRYDGLPLDPAGYDIAGEAEQTLHFGLNHLRLVIERTPAG